MKTTIVRCVRDYEGINNVIYTLGIDKEEKPTVRLSATGTTNDDQTKIIDMHATVEGCDSICCLYETLKAILKDLDREVDYYGKEEEIGF